MVTIKKKQFFITLRENWFGYSFTLLDLLLPACYRGIREIKKPFYFGFKKPTITLVLSLDKSIEEIYNDFSDTHKKHIKRGEKAGMECYFHNDIKGFIEFFNDFAESKNLPTFDVNRLDEFSGKEWTFSYAVLNGKILSCLSHIEDKETGNVRAMQGASVRLTDGFDPKQSAHATKLLYYYNIKHFKEKGYRYYDFGGWNNLPGLLDFKESFGAKQVPVVNYFTWTYQLKEWIQELLRSLKKSRKQQ